MNRSELIKKAERKWLESQAAEKYDSSAPVSSNPFIEKQKALTKDSGVLDIISAQDPMAFQPEESGRGLNYMDAGPAAAKGAAASAGLLSAAGILPAIGAELTAPAVTAGVKSPLSKGMKFVEEQKAGLLNKPWESVKDVANKGSEIAKSALDKVGTVLEDESKLVPLVGAGSLLAGENPKDALINALIFGNLGRGGQILKKVGGLLRRKP